MTTTTYHLVTTHEMTAAPGQNQNTIVHGTVGVSLEDQNGGVLWSDSCTLPTSGVAVGRTGSRSLTGDRNGSVDGRSITWHADGTYEAEQGGDGQIAVLVSLSYDGTTYQSGFDVPIGAR